MLWKLYFWILSVLVAIGLFAGVVLTNSYNAFDWVGLIISILSLFGLFTFVYKKPIFTAQVWKVIFWISIVLDAYYLFYESTPVKDFVPNFLRPNVSSSNAIETLIGVVLELPILYALYQLTYNQQWHLKKEDTQKREFSMVSKEKTFWWQTSSIMLIIYGFIYLLGLAANAETFVNSPIEGKIFAAILGLVQIIIGVLLWFRINLALLLAIIYFTFRTVVLLGVGHYGEFVFNTIVFVSLFVLILKSQLGIHKK